MTMLPASYILKTEAEISSEMLVPIYQFTRYQNIKDSNLINVNKD
jgi:hypothetical protein